MTETEILNRQIQEDKEGTGEMKHTFTECVLHPDEESPVFGNGRIIIRVEDNAAGPFLRVFGDNQEPDDNETPHDIFLQSEAEILKFAAACIAMLKQADNAEPVAVVETDSKGG